MVIKQFSLFLENRKGRLAEALGDLSEGNVNLNSLSVVDTKDFGVMRMTTDDVEAAENTLKAKGYTYNVTNVLAFDDNFSEFATLLKRFDENNISIEYIYTFTNKRQLKNYTVIRVDDMQKALKLLKEEGVS